MKRIFNITIYLCLGVSIWLIVKEVFVLKVIFAIYGAFSLLKKERGREYEK